MRWAGVSAEGTYGSFQSFFSCKAFLKPLLTPSRRAPALVQQLQHWPSVMLHLFLSVYIQIYLFIWVTTTLRRSCSKSLLPLVFMFQKNLLFVKCCSLFCSLQKIRVKRESASLRTLSCCLVCGWTRVTVRQTAVDEAIHFSHWRGPLGEGDSFWGQTFRTPA